MADDLGYGGIGCYGNTTIATPNLDRMAHQGVRLTDFHSNGAVCTPTRAALLTGRYQQRAGLEGVIYAKGETRKVGIDSAEVTLAEVLSEHGYATGIMGKWHLGYEKEFNPIYNGFEEFWGYVSGNVDFHSHFDGAGIYDWWHNADIVLEEGYVTDLITKHSVSFIEKNKAHPFFLYVPHEAPHVPFQGRNDPAYRFSDNEFTYYGPVEDRERAYREMIEVMDEGIGKIIQALEQHDLIENTVVVFISDNGAEAFGHNGVVRGDKGSLLEGGHRVPGIVQWQGKIIPGESDAPTMTHDLMPTFLEWAGVTNLASYKFDGVSLTPILLEQNSLPQRDLFWRYRGNSVIRSGNDKLIITPKDTLLYNLALDIAEENNIRSEFPDLEKELIIKLNNWEHKMNSIEQKTL